MCKASVLVVVFPLLALLSTTVMPMCQIDTATIATANTECKNFTQPDFLQQLHWKLSSAFFCVPIVSVTVHRQDAWACCIFCTQLWSIDIRVEVLVWIFLQTVKERIFFLSCWNRQCSLSCVSVKCKLLNFVILGRYHMIQWVHFLLSSGL